MERLRAAEVMLKGLLPEINSKLRDAEKFPWHLVRLAGMPDGVRRAIHELRAMIGGGLDGIRKRIGEIDSFDESMLDGRWRPSRDIGANIACAGYAQEQLNRLKESLVNWSERLEKNLPPVAGSGFQAYEAEPPREKEPGKVLTNLNYDA